MFAAASLLAGVMFASACPVKSSEGELLASGKRIVDCPIPFDRERETLTLAYRCKHQGECKRLDIDPQLIVLHHTASRTFAEGWHTFARARLDPGRKELAAGGDVNVSAHFLVDRDGTVYRLMPETRMARHAIGLNHLAIGVENVGGVEGAPLTRAQVEADAALVRWLVGRYPAIKRLIGHHEARSLERVPSLYLERDPRYRTTKPDPGERFMSDVRARVRDLGLAGAEP